MPEEWKQWTREEAIDLIEAFRGRPVLWDPSHVHFRERKKKVEAFKDLARIFQTNTREVERKIKNLNSQFQREIRIYEKNIKPGASYRCKAKWFAYDAMSFLRDKYVPRKRSLIDFEESSSSDQEIEEIQSDTQSTTELLIESGGEALSTFQHPVAEVLPTSKLHAQPPRHRHAYSTLKSSSQRKFSKDSDDTSESSQVFQMIKSVFERKDREEPVSQGRDECDTFGEIVAHNLRSLKTEYSKVRLQHLISNLLYEARIGSYDFPQSTGNAACSCSDIAVTYELSKTTK